MSDRLRKINAEEGRGLCTTCEAFVTTTENLAPYGAGNWPHTYTECGSEDCLADESLEMIDGLGTDRFLCPHWVEPEIAHCEKHGDYLMRDGCQDCIVEDLGY